MFKFLKKSTLILYNHRYRATGVACKNLNRNFICFEIDETYFNIVRDRINEVHGK